MFSKGFPEFIETKKTHQMMCLLLFLLDLNQGPSD